MMLFSRHTENNYWTNKNVGEEKISAVEKPIPFPIPRHNYKKLTNSCTLL